MFSQETDSNFTPKNATRIHENFILRYGSEHYSKKVSLWLKLQQTVSDNSINCWLGNNHVFIMNNLEYTG